MRLPTRSLLPSPSLPLVYFGGAHLSLAAACGFLVATPDLSAGFYHPRAIALVHLVTLGWISSSILGALYIVAPLAFRVPLRASRLDAAACAAFWTGTIVMVAGFWSFRYDVVGAGSVFVVAAMIAVGARVTRGLRRARMPWGVSLHVALAFANIAAAGGFGLFLAVNRMTGSLPWSPLSLAAAHAHLAVLGWATMMILGVAYRLIPMFVPAAMPTGKRLAASAIVLEIGTLGVTACLAAGASPLPWTPFVVAAFASFFMQVRGIVRNRRPRPVDLPRVDWSTWHTHLALGYLAVATGIGIRLAIGAPTPALIWAYGATALLGFVAQMVIGIGGRLLPMYAWYRAMELAGGALPGRSVHRLIVPSLARAVLVCWTAGLPVLTIGLMWTDPAAIAGGGGLLLVGTCLNAAHVALFVSRAATALRQPPLPSTNAPSRRAADAVFTGR